MFAQKKFLFISASIICIILVQKKNAIMQIPVMAIIFIDTVTLCEFRYFFLFMFCQSLTPSLTLSTSRSFDYIIVVILAKCSCRSRCIDNQTNTRWCSDGMTFCCGCRCAVRLAPTLIVLLFLFVSTKEGREIILVSLDTVY